MSGCGELERDGDLHQSATNGGELDRTASNVERAATSQNEKATLLEIEGGDVGELESDGDLQRAAARFEGEICDREGDMGERER